MDESFFGGEERETGAGNLPSEDPTILREDREGRT